MDTDHSSHGDWVRATRNQPCPVCGKPDWCVFTDNMVLCMRVESPRPSKGDAGGWLHARGDAPAHGRPRRRRLVDPATRPDFDVLTDQFIDAMTTAHAEVLSAQLGVSVQSLRMTGAGWCKERQAWSWPMHDHRLRVVGIRLRDARTHHKYAIPGSKQGVFRAACLDHFFLAKRVLVTEGPTDLCAAEDLGFAAIGRPSCTGGTRHVVELTRGREVVIIADADEPGRRGAQALVAALLPTVLGVRVIEPPAEHKDLRGWLCAGATTRAVNACIDATPLQTIGVRIRR